MKRIVTWAVIALIIFAIVYNPTGMANVVKALGGGFLHVASSFGTFVTNLIG